MGSSKIAGYDPEVWEAGKAMLQALLKCLNYLAQHDPSNSYKVLKHQLNKGSATAEMLLSDAAIDLMNDEMKGVVELVKAERRQSCGNEHTKH